MFYVLSFLFDTSEVPKDWEAQITTESLLVACCSADIMATLICWCLADLRIRGSCIAALNHVLLLPYNSTPSLR